MHARLHARRFTLVELLTVIVIIMILVGILMPTIAIIIKKTETVQTKARMKTLLLAIKQYESTYGVFPCATGTGDTLVVNGETDSTTYTAIINVLKGSNVRAIQFLEPTNVQTGAFQDAWQNNYVLLFDQNYNNAISVPTSAINLSTSVGIYSYGADEEIDEGRSSGQTSASDKHDDVASWEN